MVVIHSATHAPATITPAPIIAPRQYTIHDGTSPVDSLTSIWTPSQGCFPVSTDIDAFWTAHPSCAPPGYSTYFSTFYYSPAICPSGWTVGCSRYDNLQGPTVEPSETAMLCVMSGYECTPGPWTLYATNTALEDAQIMIEIRWAESDLSVLETHPMTPGLKFGQSTPVCDATETACGSSPSVTVTHIVNKNTGRISDPVKIGIGVGLGIAVILFIVLAVFLIMRYRTNRKARGTNGPVMTGAMMAPALPPQGQPPPNPHWSHMSMPVPAPQPGMMMPLAQPAPYGDVQNYPGYTTYVDPKTGAVSYYKAMPPQATSPSPPIPPSTLQTLVSMNNGNSMMGSPSSEYADLNSAYPTFSSMGKRPSPMATPPPAQTRNAPATYPRPGIAEMPA